MPKVATYYQLLDNPVDVSATPLTLNQSVADTPAGGEGALVTWLAAGIAGVVTYNVKVNGNNLGDYTAISIGGSGGIPAVVIPVQEATTTSAVHQGSNNVVFTKTGGTGTLRLSAVMLWHRVNV